MRSSFNKASKASDVRAHIYRSHSYSANIWQNMKSKCQGISNLFWNSVMTSFLWRHNYRDGVSNHQPHDCLLNRLFRCRWKKTSKLRITGLCAGNSPVTGEFPTQRASNAENVSIWWRHVKFTPLRTDMEMEHDSLKTKQKQQQQNT